MKWLYLILFIGCGANAVNLSKKVNSDDEVDENNSHLISHSNEEIPWNKKEQLYWGTASIVFLVLFII
ncbi:TPA: hypothetical protein TVB38_000503 [Streptococcus equi subsp. equi]|nr:hypothetical protein [Streptococcus equi subsp. equi]